MMSQVLNLSLKFLIGINYQFCLFNAIIYLQHQYFQQLARFAPGMTTSSDGCDKMLIRHWQSLYHVPLQYQLMLLHDAHYL